MNGSENKSTIIKAFVAAWGEFKHPSKNGTNPHFKSKFATLDEVINSNKEILKKHGIAVISEPFGDGETVTIQTVLLHESGEFLEIGSLTLKPVKNDPQGIGSAITYGRRYSLASAMGIASEEDDDGNSASITGQNNTSKRNNQVQKLQNIATETQIKKMFAVAKNKGLTEEELRKDMAELFSKDSFKTLTVEEVSMLIDMYEKLSQKQA